MDSIKKSNSLEEHLISLVKAQTEFTSKALMILSLGVKNIYSKEEAALFLNLDPDYLYQLKFHNKIKAYKKKGQKKIYFKREDLEKYVLSDDEANCDDFEKEIIDKWKK